MQKNHTLSYKMLVKMEKLKQAQPTGTSICVPLYKFLKYVGVFPCSFEFHPVPKGFDGVLPLRKIYAEPSGKFVLLCKLVLFTHCMHSLFQAFQLFWNLVILKEDFGTIMSLVAWCGTSMLGLLVALKHYKDRDSICAWMTDINALEEEIYGILLSRTIYLYCEKLLFQNFETLVLKMIASIFLIMVLNLLITLFSQNPRKIQKPWKPCVNLCCPTHP